MAIHYLPHLPFVQGVQRGILSAACLLMICNLALSLPASGQKTVYTTFDPPGSITTIPTSINGAGEIAGYYFSADNNYHGFLRTRNGAFQTFNFPGATETQANCINAAGQITGIYYTEDYFFPEHGFLPPAFR